MLIREGKACEKESLKDCTEREYRILFRKEQFNKNVEAQNWLNMITLLKKT